MYYVVMGKSMIGDTHWVRAEEGRGTIWYDDGGNTVLRVPHNHDVEAVLREYCTGGQRWAKTERIPGEFHPRMQRELMPHLSAPPPMTEMYAAACASAVTAARSLFVRADEVFRFIEPDRENIKTFGHELRHLLILACTEVESGLKAVLEANRAQPLRRRYEMRDYLRLVGPMRLAEWRLQLLGFPGAPPLEPFLGCTATRPPSWWSDYNAVKHDRERELPRATLKNVLEALAGVYVVVAAQFGVGAVHFRGGVPLDMALALAEDGWPRWALSELYVPPSVPGGRDKWTEVPAVFQSERCSP
jgi:hypothetical protein